MADGGADTRGVQFPLFTGTFPENKTLGDTPVLFAPGIVSTEESQHSCLTVSPAFDQIFWEGSTVLGDSGYSVGRVYTIRKVNGKWMPPETAPFSPTYDTGDDVPMFSPDGLRLYFISRRPVPPDNRAGKENIWYVERTSDGWTAPKPVSQSVNRNQMYWQFAVSGKGNLIFSSSKAGGKGMGDLYFAAFKNGTYAVPVNMGKTINSEYSEGSPFVSPDERYLIFPRYGQNEGSGGPDLYISFKNKSGVWGKPVNMGETVNSPGNDLCPYVSPDGKYLFLMSSRNGNNDIFWMSAQIIKELERESEK